MSLNNKLKLFLCSVSLSVSAVSLQATPQETQDYIRFANSGRLLPGEDLLHSFQRTLAWTENFQNASIPLNKRARLCMGANLLYRHKAIVKAQEDGLEKVNTFKGFLFEHIIIDLEPKETSEALRLFNHAKIWYGILTAVFTQVDEVLFDNNHYRQAWDLLQSVNTPPYTVTARLWAAHLIIKNGFNSADNRSDSLEQAWNLLQETYKEAPQRHIEELRDEARRQRDDAHQAAAQEPINPENAEMIQAEPQNPDNIPSAVSHPPFMNQQDMEKLRDNLVVKYHQQMQDIHEDQNANLSDASNADSDSDTDSDSDHHGGDAGLIAQEVYVYGQTLSPEVDKKKKESRDEKILNEFHSLGNKATASAVSRNTGYSLKICLKVLKEEGLIKGKEKHQSHLTDKEVKKILNLYNSYQAQYSSWPQARLIKLIITQTDNKYSFTAVKDLVDGKTYQKRRLPKHKNPKIIAEVTEAFNQLTPKEKRKPLKILQNKLHYSEKVIIKVLEDSGYRERVTSKKGKYNVSRYITSDNQYKERDKKIIKAAKKALSHEGKFTLNRLEKETGITRHTIADVLKNAGLYQPRSQAKKKKAELYTPLSRGKNEAIQDPKTLEEKAAVDTSKKSSLGKRRKEQDTPEQPNPKRKKVASDHLQSEVEVLRENIQTYEQEQNFEVKSPENIENQPLAVKETKTISKGPNTRTKAATNLLSRQPTKKSLMPKRGGKK